VTWGRKAPVATGALNSGLTPSVSPARNEPAHHQTSRTRLGAFVRPGATCGLRPEGLSTGPKSRGRRGSQGLLFRILGPLIDAIESLIGTMPSPMARRVPTMLHRCGREAIVGRGAASIGCEDVATLRGIRRVTVLPCRMRKPHLRGAGRAFSVPPHRAKAEASVPAPRVWAVPTTRLRSTLRMMSVDDQHSPTARNGGPRSVPSVATVRRARLGGALPRRCHGKKADDRIVSSRHLGLLLRPCIWRAVAMKQVGRTDVPIFTWTFGRAACIPHDRRVKA
jgi:hypothetical protein